MIVDSPHILFHFEHGTLKMVSSVLNVFKICPRKWMCSIFVVCITITLLLAFITGKKLCGGGGGGGGGSLQCGQAPMVAVVEILTSSGPQLGGEPRSQAFLSTPYPKIK